MSSGFSGGYPDYFNANSTVNRNSYNQQMNYRSPLAGILSDMMVSPRSDLIGKRSLAEFQQQQQFRQQGSIYSRNVKPRGYYQQQQTPVVDLFNSPEISSVSNITSSSSSVSRYGNGSFNGGMVSNYLVNKQEREKNMLHRLQELEKELLLDDDDEIINDNGNDAVSAVTDTEWSETIQKLLNDTVSVAKKPGKFHNNNNNINIVSPSPTTSSSSSCASSSSTVSTKQLISDAAEAITDGKPDMALELITRLQQISSARGTPEQRIGFYIASALRTRVERVITTLEGQQTSSATEIYKKEHILSTQLMYDKSPCFKLAFMGANNVIMQSVSRSGRPERKIHVVDFDVGHGLQYMYLLHQIAAARKFDNGLFRISLKLTTFKDFGNGGVEKLKGLKLFSNKLGVSFNYNVLDFKLSEISTHGLGIESDDVLAVNFAFKLKNLPDESVTTENLRDEVLRRVKGLSPAVVTVAEQELNGNTASFMARVNDAFSYYTMFLDSCDATIPRENPERVKIEEGLSRRIVNSVACEGRDRVERCEVFGKWRARMRMAGFEPIPVSQLTVDSLLSKLNSGTRGNPGFTVKEDSGGISFGWLGRTLTVVSAWH